MSEQAFNQYAPPIATVADAAPDVSQAELNLFSSKGRIGRLRYLAYGFGASIVHSIASAALTAGVGQSTPLGLGIGGVLLIALLWFSIITGIKRCHDLNISGWWTLTLIIPLIALVWAFVPGSQTGNRFGPPPPPNPLGVKLLGLAFPVVFVIGIVAAIALPAYSTYMKRQHAATSQTAPQR